MSGVLIALLFQQKVNRIDDQISKKLLGWNPVAIKKMVVLRDGFDSVTFTKGDGVWKKNKKFDGMGIASQILLYLSTIQIENNTQKLDSFVLSSPIYLATFDKNSQLINSLTIGKDVYPGVCSAILNNESNVKLLYSNLNSKSLRALLDSII